MQQLSLRKIYFNFELDFLFNRNFKINLNNFYFRFIFKFFKSNIIIYLNFNNILLLKNFISLFYFIFKDTFINIFILDNCMNILFKFLSFYLLINYYNFKYLNSNIVICFDNYFIINNLFRFLNFCNVNFFDISAVLIGNQFVSLFDDFVLNEDFFVFNLDATKLTDFWLNNYFFYLTNLFCSVYYLNNSLQNYDFRKLFVLYKDDVDKKTYNIHNYSYFFIKAMNIVSFFRFSLIYICQVLNIIIIRIYAYFKSIS